MFCAKEANRFQHNAPPPAMVSRVYLLLVLRDE